MASFEAVSYTHLDVYKRQVENKQKFISQIMTSKSPVRSCEDVDATALSFAAIKADVYKRQAHTHLLQPVMLQIALAGLKLRHG